MSVSKPAYDPLELMEKVREFATRIGPDGLEERRYYRFRGGRWYGGIATADVVGCNLRCGFCWSWREASHKMSEGFFYKPDEVFRKLVSIAEKHKYKLVRLSGGEPTISKKHILKLLELFRDTDFTFILETNGILIGV
ncbi:MAG: radical SAM protein, partial [Thermoproteota archaeon]